MHGRELPDAGFTHCASAASRVDGDVSRHAHRRRGPKRGCQKQSGRAAWHQPPQGTPAWWLHTQAGAAAGSAGVESSKPVAGSACEMLHRGELLAVNHRLHSRTIPIQVDAADLREIRQAFTQARRAQGGSGGVGGGGHEAARLVGMRPGSVDCSCELLNGSFVSEERPGSESEGLGTDKSSKRLQWECSSFREWTSICRCGISIHSADRALQVFAIRRSTFHTCRPLESELLATLHTL